MLEETIAISTLLPSARFDPLSAHGNPHLRDEGLWYGDIVMYQS